MARRACASASVGREQPLADPQQRLGVAAVEGMQLAELARQQIARPLGHNPLVDLEALISVASEPGGGGGDPRLLARARVLLHCPGALQVARPECAAFD
jgi:hypothetical protein